MHFLLDANLPRMAATMIRSCGHEATDVRDIGMRYASDDEIARRAVTDRAALVTRDFDVADVRNYPPDRYAGIVVLDLPDDATADDVTAVLERFLRDAGLLQLLPGRLAIVDPTRVRFRPRPPKQGSAP